MEKLICSIEKYIKHLRGMGLSISIHFTPESISRLPYSVWKRLLPYNSHDNLYCLRVKSECAEKCIAHQREIISAGGEGRVTLCHAGVLEYIMGIELDGKRIGYAAVSGYREDTAENCRDCDLWRSSLCIDAIPLDLCDALIPPLCIMLSDLFSLSKNSEINEYNMISQYLAENHTAISFPDFCRHFSRSRSYMSHMFGRVFGKSFSEYCNDLRLADARRMLLVTDTSVTDIALATGFGDVSYFIRLFKARYGMSPLKFRKENR